jgi:hypothetical protein
MSKSKKKQREAAKLKRQEKQFFMWTAIVTLVTLVIVYIFIIR